MLFKVKTVDRVVSVVSSVALALALVPTVAYAVDAEELGQNEPEKTIQKDTFDQGASSDAAKKEAPAETLVAVQAESGDESSSGESASSGDSASASTGDHKPPVAGPHTISWANTGADAKAWFNDELAVVQNGSAELVSVTLPEDQGSTQLTKDELSKKTSSDSAYYLNGVLCAPEGSTVVMKLLPARGYQLKSNTINGGNIEIKADAKEDQVGVYSLEMPSDGVALDCGFEAAKDTVSSDSAAIPAGTITGADSAITNGTLDLAISDIKDDTAKKNLAAKASSADAVVAYLDLSLANVINQGSEAATWKTSLTTLPNTISLTLTLSDDIAKSASSFYIVREHEGEYQQASVSFDAASKSITFRTDRFSSYAIVKGAPGNSANANNNTNANTNTNTNTNTNANPTTPSNSTSNTSNAGSNTGSSASSSNLPKTGDTNNMVPFAICAVCSAVIAAYALRRLRIRED